MIMRTMILWGLHCCATQGVADTALSSGHLRLLPFRSLRRMIPSTLLSFIDTSSAGWLFSRAFYATKPRFILGVNIQGVKTNSRS